MIIRRPTVAKLRMPRIVVRCCPLIPVKNWVSVSLYNFEYIRLAKNCGNNTNIGMLHPGFARIHVFHLDTSSLPLLFDSKNRLDKFQPQCTNSFYIGIICQ